ncbi:4332_t:CDS:2 [Paraglomus brasilianum]|uniref:4332_t:CDS:1 n=1 Tax=Paraglomus brasilianum TaxID=144538 RepID=A0A9N9B1T8_9GLOM|nr:4332_t:CDS:2 [Paraglomus brasilianum]
MAARLPYECLELILNNIPKDDISTLHSALLVNRSWCSIVVNILWKYPFTVSADLPSHYKIISVLYECLSDEARASTKLDIPSEKQRHTFSYPCLIKELDFKKLYDLSLTWRCDVEEARIRAWYQLDVKERMKSKVLQVLECGLDDAENYRRLRLRNRTSDNDWESDDERSAGTSTEMKIVLLTVELCKLIVSHAEISNLKITTRGLPRVWSLDYDGHLAVSTYPGAQKCFAKLREFTCHGVFLKDKLVLPLSTISQNITKIDIGDQHVSTIIELEKFIRSQRSLQHFMFHGNYCDLSSVVQALGVHKNTLKHLEINSGYFRSRHAFAGLSECHNLETLRLKQCYLPDYHLKPLAEGELRNLRCIELEDIPDVWSDIDDDEEDFDPPIEQFKRLMSSIGAQLEEVRIPVDLYYYPGLVRATAAHCSNLRVFAANIKTDEHVDELLELLRSCDRLEELSLERLDLSKWEIPYEVMDEILKRFPDGLQYLAWHSYDFSRNPDKVRNKYADMLQSKGFIVKSLKADSQREGSRWARPIYKIAVEFEK